MFNDLMENIEWFMIRTRMDEVLTLSLNHSRYVFRSLYAEYAITGSTQLIFRFEIGDAYLGAVSRWTTSAHWEKLASDILTGNWEVALEELDTPRETIDSRAHPPPPFSPDLYFLSVALHSLSFIHTHGLCTGLLSSALATLVVGHSSLTTGYLNPPACGSCATFPLLPFFLARHRLHKLLPDHDQIVSGTDCPP
ncbi:hypothetical protein M378DRAFT_16562 [Amanita muscaria Koide BX008]|uniref:Uncharacterized protein n=1 Tax=Amanita muscaria (strain Koide BX008) TaxID=946122 RepID=A0A0C2W7C9_AMAMK|nr:hypothetical protein M378DRAFT_16562 [Amanita muscaria Koide BX008]